MACRDMLHGDKVRTGMPWAGVSSGVGGGVEVGWGGVFSRVGWDRSLAGGEWGDRGVIGKRVGES